jgi:uncharacterized protein (TIGR02246 family)
MSTRDVDNRQAVEALYQELLSRWNDRDGRAMAVLFTEQGHMVGFDGSQADGRAAIESHLSGVFNHHPTAAFVGKIRGVDPIGDEVALLRAVAGMVPPGQPDLNPAVNAVQSMVAFREPEGWRIALFQNTPAALHGRPEDSERLTDELRQVLRERGVAHSSGRALRP